ncbi:hypothetical protein R3P38DRAFT_2818100 [Favolaschia claudopus]|uniref:Uncharacterized protein n=1 Tax=Favolaschia claudopus TaxID=2862362 RepID=A0AAV9YXX9_9AGAR
MAAEDRPSTEVFGGIDDDDEIFPPLLVVVEIEGVLVIGDRPSPDVFDSPGDPVVLEVEVGGTHESGMGMTTRLVRFGVGLQGSSVWDVVEAGGPSVFDVVVSGTSVMTGVHDIVVMARAESAESRLIVRIGKDIIWDGCEKENEDGRSTYWAYSIFDVQRGELVSQDDPEIENEEHEEGKKFERKGIPCPAGGMEGLVKSCWV